MKSRHVAAYALMFASLVGCGSYEGSGWEEGDVAKAELAGTSAANGLVGVNGLGSMYGLDSHNGLDSMNGLNTTEGLNNFTGLMETEEGRTLVEYIVRCALPEGRTIVKHYFDEFDNEISVPFHGALGVAAEWEYTRCDFHCQERMSACLLAHLNSAGTHVPIFVVGTAEDFPYIGPALDLDTFPRQEAAFYGNLFLSPPVAYQCDGANLLPNVIPGRAGSPGPHEYENQGPCVSACNTSFGAHGDEQTPDGFSTCAGWAHVLTVYTQ